MDISKQIYLPSLAAGLTYDIDTYADFPYTIKEVYQIQTSSGTVTAAVKINGTAVTGLSGISVTSTPQNVAATGANSVSIGDHVTLVFSSNSGATNINMTLAASRTDAPGGSSGQVQYNNSGAFGGLANGQLPATSTNDNASAGNVGEYVSAGATGASSTVTISNASPAVITWSGHGLTANAPVNFTTTGTLPTGLSVGTNYYVVGASITANTFEVATSIANAIAGTAVNTSSAGTGTQTATSSVVLTSGTVTNLTGISLTAGDWDVCGSVFYSQGAGTTTTFYGQALTTTSATFPATPYVADNATTLMEGSFSAGLASQSMGVGPARFSLAATTTVYLVADSIFAVSTMTAYGFLRARRIR